MFRYKRDALVQAAFDSRDLATIALFLEKHGRKPRNKSDLLKTAIETFSDFLADAGERVIKTTEEAREVLAQFNILELNSSNRLVHSLREKVAVEAVMKQQPQGQNLIDNVLNRTTQRRKAYGGPPRQEFDLDEARRIAKEIAEANKKVNQ